MGMEPGEAREQCDKEYEAARKVGAAVERAKGVPLKGFEDAPVLRYPDQATFHPLKYLAGTGGSDPRKRRAHLRRQRGDEDRGAAERRPVYHGQTAAAIDAATAVFATNSPINDRVALHSKMAPYRTYAMAFTLPRGTLPDALYWDMADPYHYVRLNPGPGAIDYLIAGGADHKTGEADDGDVRFEAIEAWIRALVPGARQGSRPLVGTGARHDRLLRLHRPQSRQRERLRRDRRFRPGHDAWRAGRHPAAAI